MKSLDTLELETIRWAEARRIIPNAKAATQLLKAISEIGELADAEIKGDIPGIVDGVGDLLIVLAIYCDLRGLTLRQCWNAAYDEIKNRKGTLLETGVFLKDAA